MNAPKKLTLVIILVLTDQCLKIVINNYSLDYSFEIIPSLLEFHPTFNTKHSYLNVLLNHYLDVNVGLVPHIILFIFIAIIILLISRSLKRADTKQVILLDISIIFFYAGLICALSGNLIWDKGTLDYIYLVPLFVFDLKDLYIDLFLLLFFIYSIKNWDKVKKVRARDLIRL